MVHTGRGGLLRDLRSLQERMNRLLEEGFSGVGGRRHLTSQWEPPVDIYEREDSFVLEVDLPGVPLQDVEVEVKDGTLHIKGKATPGEGIPSSGVFLKQERPAGDFHRVFSLPADTEHDRVRARLKNGVLAVNVPKKEAARSRQIPVNAP